MGIHGRSRRRRGGERGREKEKREEKRTEKGSGEATTICVNTKSHGKQQRTLVWVIMPTEGQNANEGPKYHRA